SCFVEYLRDLQAGQHTCNPIEAASTGNRVRMRAEHDGAGTRFRTRTFTNQVRPGIQPYFQAGSPEFRSEPLATFYVQIRKGTARIGPVRLGEFGQAGNAVRETGGIYVHGAHASLRTVVVTGFLTMPDRVIIPFSELEK